MKSGCSITVDNDVSIERIARVLIGSVNAEADLKNFLKTQLLFWMMAAPDGHAKNFGLRILPRGALRTYAAVRRGVHLARRRQRCKPVLLAQGQARHGAA